MGRLIAMFASTGKNAKLAETICQQAIDMGHEAETLDLCALDLPIYTPETEAEIGSLPAIQSSMNMLSKGDGWIVCAPEYNGLMPPVLNNFIAWLSREGDDFRSLFRFRRIALATVSGGGGQTCIVGMRLQFAHLGSTVLGRSIIINKNRPQHADSIDAVIEELMN